MAVRIRPMKLPPADLSWFAETLTESVQEIIDAWNDAGSQATDDELSPDLLQNALEQLIEVLQLVEWNHTAESPDPNGALAQADVSELGDYGLNMLTELSQIATDLGLPEQVEHLERLALSLALWVLQQEGDLASIELVVNALARLANDTVEAFELEQLFHTMSDILSAVLPAETTDLSEHGRQPWQLLLLNRAIVATRTLSPQLMEQAFSDVVEQLPEEAANFFREGMEQVKLRDYPQHVSEVIERYYHAWPPVKLLH